MGICELAGLLLGVDGPDQFGRAGERRVGRADQGLADQAGDLAAGQRVLQRPDEPVADHSLGLRAEHIERVGMGQGRVAGALQRQQADLRAVAVGDDQFVLAGQRGERGNRFEDVLFLDLGFRRLPPFQQGVPAEGGHDSHAFSWFPGTFSSGRGLGSLARPPFAVPSIWTLLLMGMTPMTPVT